MLWTDVLAEMTHLETSGPEGDVSGVQYDSRRVVAGDVFVAMRGESADGNRYVEQALRGGAAALVMDSPEVFARLKKAGLDVGLALVGNGRRALAGAAAAECGTEECAGGNDRDACCRRGAQLATHDA